MWFCSCCASSGDQEVADHALKRSKYACDDDLGDHQGDAPTFRQFPPVHKDGVMCVCPEEPGVCLSGSKDQTIVLFNFNDGIEMGNWCGHDKEVTKVAYSPQHRSYFSASRDRTVKMWQGGEYMPSMTFTGHDLVVTGLSLNPDETQICTGSRDNSLRVWDLQSGQCVNQNNISRNLVTHVKWSLNGDIIAQTGEDKEVKIWDASNLLPIVKFPRKMHIQTCCDMSQDGVYCLTCSNGFGGNGCEASLWDIRTKSLVCEYKGHTETVGACAYLPAAVCGGRKLFATTSNDCSVRIWDQDTQACLAYHTLSGSGPLTSIAAFEDGSLCVSSLNMGVYVLELKQTSSGDWRLQHTISY